MSVELKMDSPPDISPEQCNEPTPKLPEQPANEVIGDLPRESANDEIAEPEPREVALSEIVPTSSLSNYHNPSEVERRARCDTSTCV